MVRVWYVVYGVWCTFAYRRSDTCENSFTIVADVVNRSRLGVLHSCTLAVVAAHPDPVSHRDWMTAYQGPTHGQGLPDAVNSQ